MIKRKKTTFLFIMAICISLTQISYTQNSRLADEIKLQFDIASLHNRTPWNEEDVNRLSSELVTMLQSFKASLSEGNYKAIEVFLPNYAQEMANAVLADIEPPSTYIDAFLTDFYGRLELISRNNVPVLLDANTRAVIKSNISSIFDDCFSQLQPTTFISVDELELLKEELILKCYEYADNPLKSVFKDPLSSEDIAIIKSRLQQNVVRIDFNKEDYLDLPESKIKRDAKSQLWRQIVVPLHNQWHREPRLGTSDEAKNLFRQGSDELFAKQVKRLEKLMPKERDQKND